uniref:Uncharacterized protein n=1 Tax=Avena sativa TaxID=4498 RepID=A0ACD5X5H4_AVESA
MARRCCHGCCPYGLKRNCKRWLLILGSCLAGAAVLAAITIVVLRFAVIPHVKAKVVDARLNGFAFATRPDNASVFAFNISVALAVRNPSGAVMKHTKPLVATFVFHDRRLYNATVAGKGHRQKPLKTKVHVVDAVGDVPADVLDAAVVDDFRKQNATSVFTVEVRLAGEITYVGLDNLGNKRKLGLSCTLGLPLAPPGPEVVVFHEVNCEAQGPDKIYF